jgi:hypothetical protein
MSASAELLTLVEVAELQAITFLEISMRVSEESAAGEAEMPPPELQLGVDINADDHRFRVRFRVEAYSDQISLAVEPAAEYSVPEADDSLFDERVLLEYANEVAVMTLVPFAREAIADITRRTLGTAVLLPIMRRGELNFAPAHEIDQET